jgi:flagellar motor component MotA
MTRVKMAFDRILYDLYESKEHWLLAMLYRLFRLGQTQGPLMLEAHYEHPEDSSIFAAGKLSFDEREFLCDSLRMIVRGGHSADVRRIMERDFANRWVLLPWKRARYRLMIEGLCAYAEGCPPLFAVDAARRSLPSIWAVRPRFDEMEAICSHLPLDIARVDGPSHAELEAAMEEILRRKRGGNDDEPSGC